MAHNAFVKYVHVGKISLDCIALKVLLSCDVNALMRHRCPHDRNASSILLGSPDVHEFKRKEYAVTTPGERTLPIKRTGELSLHGLANDSDVSQSYAKEADAIKSSSIQRYTRITSGAVRRHKNDSSIQLGAENENMIVDSANHTLKERLMAKRPQENALTCNQKHSQMLFEVDRTKHARNEISEEDGENMQRHTEIRKQYITRNGVRTEISRTQTRQIATSEGIMQADSVSHEEYSGKKGERYETKRPVDSDLFKGSGSFTAETQNNTDFTPKRGERYVLIRPGSSDIWKDLRNESNKGKHLAAVTDMDIFTYDQNFTTSTPKGTGNEKIDGSKSHLVSTS
ncbi:unnamed protein product [Anisakis simplex]|uniref:Uncharacterized protein n=1 Tax=Anisakis simplex TaxID=6269 RepID=A0A0M3IY18_ANISI|nr:unnamed protein product [Anisakis simplex]